MTTLKKIFAVTSIIGALFMTTPNIPNENSGGMELPAAITGVPVSSTVTRIGQVVDIVESDNITVAISGSPTLVRASYLFPQYQPLLGDFVYVQLQDAQWAVLGTLSGPLNSLALNPSFEDGTLSTTPDNWSTTVVSSAAGTPTFRKELALPIAGSFIGIFRNASAAAAGTSTLDVFSATTSGTSGQSWALGFFLTFAVPDVNAALVPQGGFLDITGFIQFLDAGGVLISEEAANYTPIYSSFITPVYVRTFTLASGAVKVIAPAGTTSVRVKFRVNFTMHANSATELGIDAVLLRSL